MEMDPVFSFIDIFVLLNGPELYLLDFLQRSFKTFFFPMGVIWDMPYEVTICETEMPLTRGGIRARSEHCLLQQAINPATNAYETQKGPHIPRLYSFNM